MNPFWNWITDPIDTGYPIDIGVTVEEPLPSQIGPDPAIPLIDISWIPTGPGTVTPPPSQLFNWAGLLLLLAGAFFLVTQDGKR